MNTFFNKADKLYYNPYLLHLKAVNIGSILPMNLYLIFHNDVCSSVHTSFHTVCVILPFLLIMYSGQWAVGREYQHLRICPVFFIRHCIFLTQFQFISLLSENNNSCNKPRCYSVRLENLGLFLKKLSFLKDFLRSYFQIWVQFG